MIILLRYLENGPLDPEEGLGDFVKIYYETWNENKSYNKLTVLYLDVKNILPIINTHLAPTVPLKS